MTSRLTNSANDKTAKIGFEAKLWLAADKLRNNMDAAEYKHVVLGLIFLKYISDVFEDHRTKLLAGRVKNAAKLSEDPNHYKASKVFWVPPGARWSHLQLHAQKSSIGKIVDEAMAAIESGNPLLRGVLPKSYSRPALDKHRLGELVELVGTIGLGDEENRSKDILGRVYEFFLAMFASAEGKNGGQFYTPSCIVRLLVEMLSPYEGKIYDPACGSGGMFVQSKRFVESHGGKVGDISVYGQESNSTTRNLAIMNLAIRGVKADFGASHADTFRQDLHPSLRADYILANPPFNDSDWFCDVADERWCFGVPPKGNANFAWVQHIIHHLAPGGLAGFVLSNGSLSANQAGEGEIRKRLVEEDLVDCVLQLPGQLFYSTSIPVCVWFVVKDKDSKAKRACTREGRTLFIDARRMGAMTDRTHKELSIADIQRLADVYHCWRGIPGRKGAESYVDIPGFCYAATVKEIREHKFALVPGRYVGFAPEERPDSSHIDIRSELAALSDRLKKISNSAAGASSVLRPLC